MDRNNLDKMYGILVKLVEVSEDNSGMTVEAFLEGNYSEIEDLIGFIGERLDD